MTFECYIDKVMREIKLSKDAKERIKEDLESDISTRIDCGMTMDEIVHELGEPKLAAKSLVGDLPYDMRYKGNPLRFIYILAALSTLIIGLYSLWRRFANYHNSSGISSRWEYIMHEVTSRFDVFIWLTLNLVLMLIVCLTGYLFFKKKWHQKEKKLLIAMIILFLILIVQQPIVYGVVIFPLLGNLSGWERAVYGIIQPQCILTIFSIYSISVMYFKGRTVGKRLFDKIARH